MLRFAALALVVMVANACSPQRSPQAADAHLSAANAAARTAGSPPNIVFVLTDDLSKNLVAHMPNVLAMKQEGTSFSRYYVVDSQCCPSRAAIFTGEYPHNDRVLDNTGSLGGYEAFQRAHDAKHSFALDLKQAGYTTAFMGKYLNGYAATDPVPRGWDLWEGVNGRGYGEYNYTLNENGSLVRYGAASSDYLTSVLSEKANEFITSASTTGSPFFLEVATFAPHRPFVPAPQDVGSASTVTYPVTPAYDAQVSHPPPWLHHRHHLTSTDRDSLLASYRLRVESDRSVDDLIAGIRSALRRAGVAGNTYVVFSSDNGFHMGEYRLLAGKQTAFETDISVPLVVTGPGVRPGVTRSLLASSIDLAPTFDAIAGAPVDGKVDGTSLLPLLRGRSPTKWQKAVLIEHHGHGPVRGDPDAQTVAQAIPPSYRAVRTRTGLYVRYYGGAQEYYDTRSDPYELHNLGGKRAPKAMKRSLRDLQRCHGKTQCQRAAIKPLRDKPGKHKRKHRRS